MTTDLVKKVCKDILEGESLADHVQYFVSKYKIGSAATARRAAESLEDKELILKTHSLDGTTYEVYDVFFSRWLEQTY